MDRKGHRMDTKRTKNELKMDRYELEIDRNGYKMDRKLTENGLKIG